MIKIANVENVFIWRCGKNCVLHSMLCRNIFQVINKISFEKGTKI
jgi:hypothetical protein